MSDGATLVMISCRADLHFAVTEPAWRFGLTPRETEVLTLLTSGLATRVISAKLGVTLNAARRHREHVLSKLGMHSRTAALAMLDG